MSQALLQIRDLRFYYHTEAGAVKAIDGVSLDLERGVRLGLVGESGCGKSTLAMAIMRMLKPPDRLESGEILLDGVDLAKLSNEEMRQVRLRKISLITQGAMNSLNPVMKVKDQLLDGMKDHEIRFSKGQAEKTVEELLDDVDLPYSVADLYPHELSGGMKQRVCVAMAIALKPQIILADEPTSALDVVVQRQVMGTIQKLQQRLDISMILIGHDMGLMAQSVERLGVMYAGRLVELGDVGAMFSRPRHPYTRLLINTLPTLGSRGHFEGIPGITPSLLNPPGGCLFAPRCPAVQPRCSIEIPAWREVEAGRLVACHYSELL
jgi:peptide/nickel transport system ATP-binding protein